MIKFSYRALFLIVLIVGSSCSNDDGDKSDDIGEGSIIINYNNNQDVFERVIEGRHRESCYEPGDNVFSLEHEDVSAAIEIQLFLYDLDPSVDAFAQNSVFPIYGFSRGGGGVYGTFQFKENNNNHNLNDGSVTLTNVRPVDSDRPEYEDAYYLSAYFTLQDPMGYTISGELRDVIFKASICI